MLQSKIVFISFHSKKYFVQQTWPGFNNAKFGSHSFQDKLDPGTEKDNFKSVSEDKNCYIILP